MHVFFGTSKIDLFAAGFGFAISIATILIPHVHTPVLYIVQNPKMSSFPISSSHFSKLKGLNFPHRNSLELHKRIQRYLWRIVPSSQVWYVSCEINHDDLPTWNIRSGRIPNKSQILKYLNCSSKRLTIQYRDSGLRQPKLFLFVVHLKSIIIIIYDSVR